MDDRSQHSKPNLPNTPRVCGKILEYYLKFGQERDLEKFMRLYSPGSSLDSEKSEGGSRGASTKALLCKATKLREPTSSSNSCEVLNMISSRPLSVSGETNSKSLPNIDIQGKVLTEEIHAAYSDVIVDINIETDGEKDQVLSLSTENFITPKKVYKSAKTQTPESVAKTHRRLEWDSLGDVGYKKSMSTSNISIIERTILKEFFKEKSVVSEPSYAPPKEDHHCNDAQIKTVQKLKTSVIENNTPPLACSTLVGKAENAANPKMLSQSTSSTSLNEKFEKSAQTSMIKQPLVRSQEVQCTLSSAHSLADGTASPSSFEYYSSRSSKSSDIVLHKNTQQQHPFITSITDLLMKRKPLGEKNQHKRHQLINIKNLQTKFQAALDENKENQTHSTLDSSSATTSFSLSKHAPELDLGIQLICSLIDAKSINARQKKQLLRDIIKRLTCLEGEDKTISSITTTTTTTTDNSSQGADNSSRCTTSNQNVYDSVNSVSSRSQQRKTTKSFEFGVTSYKAEQMSTKEESSVSNTDKSEAGNDIIAAMQPKKNTKSRSQNFSESSLFEQQNSCEQLPVKISHKAATQNHIRLLEAAIKIDTGTQSETINTERNLNENKQITTNGKLAPVSLEAKYVKANRCTQTSRTSSTSSPSEANCKLTTVSLNSKDLGINRCTQTSKTSSTTCTASETTTPDLTTQKLKVNANPELNNSNTDAEQPTMREWLNPLTQSEIEYEQKKQIEMRKKVTAAAEEQQREKIIKKSIHKCKRVQQLNWIDNEIKRLECLKHLLLNDETSSRSSTTTVSNCNTSIQKNSTKNFKQMTEKLYDTVYTDKSSVLSESAEKLVQEIEIILEQSEDELNNFKDDFKVCKITKNKTQIVYEKEKDSLKTKCVSKIPIELPNEEELFKQIEAGKVIDKKQKQREKIDTPSTEVSKESESLKDMVLQRKREFMKAYKNKKQHHYEALKQQQKQDFKYTNLPQQLSAKPATTTDSEHYSVPHTIPRKFVNRSVDYYAQQPLPMAPIEKQDKPKQSLKKPTTSTKTVDTNNYTTTTSSSMFCMSSEISVPMRSHNTSSSPLSTSHYNDKVTRANKTGVGVQTSDSIKFTNPIFGPASLHPTLIPHNPTAYSSTACIQVKPKGIAYVIEFDDNKQAPSNPLSDTDDNNSTNFLQEKSNKKPQQVNNLKSPSENEKLLTLQEHLEKSKPKFLKHSKERKAVLNQLQLMRQERVRQLREIIENTSLNSLDRRLQYLPPPPIQKVRILKTKEMKALTNKRFANLPEIVAKQEREIEERKRRSNRILRDVFNKRLQKRVRTGKLSLNHSKTVI